MPLLVALSLAAAPVALPPCSIEQLSLAFDAQGGAFDGMSHSGTLLVIRNLGPNACRMPGIPKLTFKDARGKPLAIARTVPRGQRTGPAASPVGVAAGAELTAPLRWVSGEVFDRSQCRQPAYAAITIGAGTLQTAFAGRICGQAGATIGFDQPILRPDPML